MSDTLTARADGTAVTWPARLTWKDARGALRFTPVRVRALTDSGAVIECDAGVALTLFRLVHFQLESSVRGGPSVPLPLRDGRTLSAVWQVAPRSRTTGTPGQYTLRFLMSAPPATVLAPARRAS